MTEDEKPLTEIIWQRLQKRFLHEAPTPCDDDHWVRDVKRNTIPLLQSALITLALWLVLYFATKDLLAVWNWSTGKLAKLQDHWPLCVAALLVCMAGMMHWIKSVITRLWRYLKQTHFVPLVMLAGAGIIEHVAQASSPCPSMSALGALLIFSAIAARLWLVANPSKCEDDLLQRSYFVDRLMTGLERGDAAKVRRFAILGGWGAGKTFVLHLLRNRLEESRTAKFGIAMVNPWKAQSIGEVHAMIAHAFEEALGYRDYVQSPFMRWNWLKAVTEYKFGNGPELGLDLKQLLGGDGSTMREDRLVQRINDILTAEDRTCVIMFDDMERASADVIRQVFPMIDVLSRIKRCFFIFAIDPTRIASAFGEQQSNEEQTKGYMDKVFDVQIRLPQPRPEDFSRMFKGKIDPILTPKLFAAWDALEPDLPETPREIIHFLNEATMRESMFLTLYGPDEHDYIAFFRLLILNLEVPGITGRITREIVENLRKGFDQVSSPPDEDGSNKEIDGICTHAWNAIVDGLDISSVKRNKLKGLFDKIALRLDLLWACNHHMRLLILNHEERKKLRLLWKEQAGHKSILEMIRIAFPNREFSDPHKIATQHMEDMLEEYGTIRDKIRRTGSPNDATQALKEATISLEHFAAHLRFARSKNEEWNLYPKIYFTSLMNVVCGRNLGDALIDTTEFESLEFEHCIEASSLLTIADAFVLSRSSQNEILLQYAHVEPRTDLSSQINKLRAHVQARLYNRLIELIGHSQIDGPEWQKEFRYHTLADVFGNLETWNPYSDNLEALSKLSVELQSNPQIAAQMVSIVGSLLGCVSRAVHHGSEIRPRGPRLGSTEASVVDIVKNHPDYISLIWRMAISCDDKFHELKRRYLDAREATLSNTRVTREQFDQAFTPP